MSQTKIANILIMGSIAALVVVSLVSIYIFANMRTDEESDSHPNSVIGIIVDLRNMRAAADIFRKNNFDKKEKTNPDLELLVHYLENPTRFTKTKGEYIFADANGKWWVGYNLAVTNKFALDRYEVSERLKTMARGTIYGSMDISIPYVRGDLVFMPVL